MVIFFDIFKYQWLILGHVSITEEKLVVSKLTQERRTASEQPHNNPTGTHSHKTE